MLRTLLTTTAFAAMLTAGAIAQDATTTTNPATTNDPNVVVVEPEVTVVEPNGTATDPAMSTDPAMTTDPAITTDPAMTTDPAVTTMDQTAPTSILATGYTVTDVDNLASEIIGRQVYSSTADDAEHIGDVNDIIIGENGQVAAVVIGVGGFLGIGEKRVAVNYSELEWVLAADNTERYILPTTQEALEAAPDFETIDATDPTMDGGMMAPADNNMMAPADNNMSPGTNVTPADPALAPADPAVTPAPVN